VGRVRVPMTLLDDRQSEGDRLQNEALFREARQRRRRRWFVGIGVAAVATVVTVCVSLAIRGHTGQASPKQSPHMRPSPSTPAPSSRSSLVTGDLKGPEALTIAPDGGVLIDEQSSNQIVERQPNGRFVVIAGNGRAGFRGDGGRATIAELDEPVAMAVTADGTIYVADLGNDRVRSIDRTGTITTVVKAEQPVALALGPSGTLFVVDQAGVQTLGGDGTLTTLVPSASGPSQDLTIDGSQVAFDPDAIAVSSSGDLYVANFSPKVVILFPAVGSPSLVGQSSLGGGGIYVTRAGLAPDPDGTVVVGDYGAFAVDRVTGSSVSVVASFSFGGISGLSGAFRPSGVAVAPDGQIYVATDGVNGGTNVPALVAIEADGQVHLLNKGIPVPQPEALRSSH
jgi:sugar lactone lactonase YvrE